MATRRITAAGVRDLEPNPKKLVFIWDTEQKGFGVRVTTKGIKSYVLQYRTAMGRQKMLTIGRATVWTTSAARKEAIRIRRDIDRGTDPMAEVSELRAAPTMNEIFDDYLKWSEANNKPRTFDRNREGVEVVLRPAFGKLKLLEMNRADIARWHMSRKATPHRINRCLMVLKRVLNLCVDEWEILAVNPAAKVKLHKTDERDAVERALDTVQLGRLGLALRSMKKEPPCCVALIRLSLFTGMRIGELMELRWADVDIKNKTLRVTDGKSGARTVRLNDEAVEVLVDVVDRGGYVIDWEGKPLSYHKLRGTWERIKARTGIKARLHDLRHTHATVAVGAGLTAWDVQGLLGHSQITTSQRYVTKAKTVDRISEASAVVGAKINDALG